MRRGSGTSRVSRSQGRRECHPGEQIAGVEREQSEQITGAEGVMEAVRGGSAGSTARGGGGGGEGATIAGRGAIMVGEVCFGIEWVRILLPVLHCGLG
jgi:outer membrane receptor protein involved in Fe transport